MPAEDFLCLVQLESVVDTATGAFHGDQLYLSREILAIIDQLSPEELETLVIGLFEERGPDLLFRLAAIADRPRENLGDVLGEISNLLRARAFLMTPAARTVLERHGIALPVCQAVNLSRYHWYEELHISASAAPETQIDRHPISGASSLRVQHRGALQPA